MFTESRGFTLLELIVLLAVAAVALSLALSSFSSATDRHRLTSSTEQVTALLVTAQSEAIKRNIPTSLIFDRTDAADWCMGATLNPMGCDCHELDPSESAYCAVDGSVQRLDSPLMNGLKLVAASDEEPGTGDGRITFDPVRGILQPTGDKLQLGFESDSGAFGLEVTIGPTGNLRICVPAGSKEVVGYPACA